MNPALRWIYPHSLGTSPQIERGLHLTKILETYARGLLLLVVLVYHYYGEKTGSSLTNFGTLPI